jgi:hypothetical protein
MKIELTNDLYAVIDATTEIKNRNNPLQVKNGRITESKLVEEYKSIYYFQHIETNDGVIVVHTKHLPEFIELLNCFVSNQLNVKKRYGFKHKNGGDFYATIKQDQGEIFLLLSIENEEIFLDKYSCKVLSSKLSKIMAKCEFEFHFTN